MLSQGIIIIESKNAFPSWGSNLSPIKQFQEECRKYVSSHSVIVIDGPSSSQEHQAQISESANAIVMDFLSDLEVKSSYMFIVQPRVFDGDVLGYDVI